jgi:hypothetical protein
MSRIGQRLVRCRGNRGRFAFDLVLQLARDDMDNLLVRAPVLARSGAAR